MSPKPKTEVRPLKLGGFTLIELLVVVAIIAVLISMLLPTLAMARRQGFNAVCLAHFKSISAALVMYALGNNDIMAPLTESPYITAGMQKGPRTTPLILRDEGYMPISDDRGGVWRCPFDNRNYKPHFKAWYYYYEGGPGNPVDAPVEGFQGSTSGNAVYREYYKMCPFSNWVWFTKTYRAQRLPNAANPSTTIAFYDSCWSFMVGADSPWLLFQSSYDGVTWEHYNWGRYPLLWEHKPTNYGPSGNVGFLDGHAGGIIDYLDTCSDNNGMKESVSKSYKWWSFTGDKNMDTN